MVIATSNYRGSSEALRLTSPPPPLSHQGTAGAQEDTSSMAEQEFRFACQQAPAFSSTSVLVPQYFGLSNKIESGLRRQRLLFKRIIHRNTLSDHKIYKATQG